jgi:hypothetical protein
MVKVATFFLLAIVVIALVSRWVRPAPPPRIGRFCPNCGKPRLGKSPCDCGGRG